MWHDTVGTKNAQTTTPNVAAPVSNVASSESNIPHFAAGNINGTITAVSVTKMTMAVAQLAQLHQRAGEHDRYGRL